MKNRQYGEIFFNNEPISSHDDPAPAWPGGLPLLVYLLTPALIVDLVERFLEAIGKSICG